MKTTTLALALAGGVMLTGLPAVATADDDGPRRDVSHTGDYTVERGQEINGNLTVRNGNVVIRGDVDGSVRQIGRGSLTITRTGEVGGNVAENGRGNLHVRGDVDGRVTELDRGHLRIFRTADIDRGARERGWGHLYVWRGADIDGGLSEAGPGRIVRR